MGEARTTARHRLPQPLLTKLNRVRRRRFFAGSFRYLTRLLLASALLYGLLRAGESLFQRDGVKLFGSPVSPVALGVLALAAVGLIGSLWLARRNARFLLDAAVEVDTHYGFRDRVATALECTDSWRAAAWTGRRNAQGATPLAPNGSTTRSATGGYAELFHKALMEEVSGLAARIEPSAVVPLRAPGLLLAGMLLVVVVEGVVLTPDPVPPTVVPVVETAHVAGVGEEPAEDTVDPIDRAVKRLTDEAIARNDLQLAAYAQRLDDLRSGATARRIGTRAESDELDALMKSLAVDYPELGNALALNSGQEAYEPGRASPAPSGSRATSATGPRLMDGNEAVDLGEAERAPDDHDSDREAAMPDGERTVEENPELLPVEAPLAQPTRVHMEITEDGSTPEPQNPQGGMGLATEEPIIIYGYWRPEPQNLARRPDPLPPWLEALREQQGSGPGAGGGGDEAGEGADGAMTGEGGTAESWSFAYSDTLGLLAEKGEGDELTRRIAPEAVESSADVGRWGVFTPDTGDVIEGRTNKESIPGHLSGLIQRYFER